MKKPAVTHLPIGIGASASALAPIDDADSAGDADAPTPTPTPSLSGDADAAWWFCGPVPAIPEDADEEATSEFAKRSGFERGDGSKRWAPGPGPRPAAAGCARATGGGEPGKNARE